ncbi:hypothetical protein [Glutamicibacter soli]
MTKPNTETLLANLTEMTTEEQQAHLATLTQEQLSALITQCQQITTEEMKGRSHNWPTQATVAYSQLADYCQAELENQE